MKKVLFITSRNITNTCGELRLIKNRAVALYNQYGIVTDFLVYTNKPLIKPEAIGAESTMKVFRYNQKNLFSIVGQMNKIKKQAKQMVKSGEYSAVIISGSLVFDIVKDIKKVDKNIKIVADIHGACEELVEFGTKKKLFRKLLFKRFKESEKRSLIKFDYLMVVSHALENYLRSEYKITAPIFIIPCAINKMVLDKEKTMEYRKAAREKYAISDDTKLFIYSGGVSPWQCIDETVEVYNQLKKSIQGKSKLLLLSGDRKYLQKYKCDDVIIDSLSFNEVEKTIPAGDFAFMLRSKYVTNIVAYPNKFLEYVKAGVKVISTPYVEDVASQIKQFNLGYILESAKYEEGLTNYCNNGFEFGSDFEDRQKLLDDTCFENRVSFFGEIIK